MTADAPATIEDPIGDDCRCIGSDRGCIGNDFWCIGDDGPRDGGAREVERSAPRLFPPSARRRRATAKSGMARYPPASWIEVEFNGDVSVGGSWQVAAPMAGISPAIAWPQIGLVTA